MAEAADPRMLRLTLDDGAFDLLDDPHDETVDNRKRNGGQLSLLRLARKPAMRSSMSGPWPSLRWISCDRPAASGRPSVSRYSRLLARRLNQALARIARQ